MTSTYRRDHQGKVGNEELNLLTTPARLDIAEAVSALDRLYPSQPGQPVAAGEYIALQRAMARFLIDSGKASANGVLS